MYQSLVVKEKKKLTMKEFLLALEIEIFKNHFFIPSSSPQLHFRLNLIRRKSTWFRNVLSHFHKISSNEMSFSVAMSIKEKRGRNRKSTFCTIALLGTQASNTVFQKLIKRPLLGGGVNLCNFGGK